MIPIVIQSILREYFGRVRAVIVRYSGHKTRSSRERLNRRKRRAIDGNDRHRVPVRHLRAGSDDADPVRESPVKRFSAEELDRGEQLGGAQNLQRFVGVDVGRRGRSGRLFLFSEESRRVFFPDPKRPLAVIPDAGSSSRILDHTGDDHKNRRVRRVHHVSAVSTGPPSNRIL